MRRGKRFDGLSVTAALALLLSAGCVQERTVITETEHAPGVRSLHLTGLIHDVDSVYMQVYHDGEAIYDQVFGNTFSVTLQSYDDYVITFTDGIGRVKRISIHELSDDLIEFYPPIEIDFARMGNLVLIKPSSGKPGFEEFDVGMSRERKPEPRAHD